MVGYARQLLDRIGVHGIERRDADAAAHAHDRTGYGRDSNAVQCVDDAFGHLHRTVTCRAGQQDHELVAAPSTTEIAVSIEARKRLGQEYSAIGGLFRQFTLIYVWADERDVVKVRATLRNALCPMSVIPWAVKASASFTRMLSSDA